MGQLAPQIIVIIVIIIIIIAIIIIIIITMWRSCLATMCIVRCHHCFVAYWTVIFVSRLLFKAGLVQFALACLANPEICEIVIYCACLNALLNSCQLTMLLLEKSVVTI